MAKKIKTTFDKWMEKPKIKDSFDKGYEEFVLSELVLALMAGDNKSVRGLAKEVGVSSTVIQKIRSGKQKDMKVSNFLKLIQECGYHIILENGRTRIPVSTQLNFKRPKF